MRRGIVQKALWDIDSELEGGRLVELLAPFAITISLFGCESSSTS